MIAFLVICYSVFYWLLFIKLRLLEKIEIRISHQNSIGTRQVPSQSGGEVGFLPSWSVTAAAL